MKHLIMNYKSRFFLLAFLLLALSGFSQIPDKPSFIHPIMDLDDTGILNQQETDAIYQKLKNYSDSTSTEILVIIVKTTNGEDIARYATDLGHKWKIGQKGKDNGIILLIAKDDRRINISTGYGTEGLMTDALSRRVIEEIIQPEFKAENYYAGIDKGTTAIMQIMKGEFKSDGKKKGGGFPFGVFVFIFIILMIIISRNSMQ